MRHVLKYRWWHKERPCRSLDKCCHQSKKVLYTCVEAPGAQPHNYCNEIFVFSSSNANHSRSQSKVTIRHKKISCKKSVWYVWNTFINISSDTLHFQYMFFISSPDFFLKTKNYNHIFMFYFTLHTVHTPKYTRYLP